MKLFPAILLALAACAGSCGGPAGPAVIRLKGRKLEVKVFATEKERHAASLLMRTLEDGHAYLFLWPRDRYAKMEPAALDAAFLDRGGKVLETARLDRQGLEGVVPEQESAAVLLLPAGELQSMGVQRGDVAEISGAPEARDLPEMKINGIPVRVELALTLAERAQGLMFRPRMSAEDGMLFTYERERGDLSFWMKNTLIPLDIAFFRENGDLVNVNETPTVEDPRKGPWPGSPAEGQARYVLEMNRGWFRKKGLLDASGKAKPGIRAEFPPEAPLGRFTD